MEGERIAGVVYGAEGQVGHIHLWKMYDLVFTDRRVVGVVVAYSGPKMVEYGVSGMGPAVGAVVAGAVSRAEADKRRALYAGQPLDTIIALDKANFSASLGGIENPRIKGLFTRYLRMKVDGKKAVFQLPKGQVEEARRLIALTFPGTTTRG